MNRSLKLVPLSWIERRFLLVDGDDEIGRLEFERAVSTRTRAEIPTTRGRSSVG